jgi:hypothetical protein
VDLKKRTQGYRATGPFFLGPIIGPIIPNTLDTSPLLGILSSRLLDKLIGCPDSDLCIPLSHAELSFELRVNNLPGLKRYQAAGDGTLATGFTRATSRPFRQQSSFTVNSHFQPASDAVRLFRPSVVMRAG